MKIKISNISKKYGQKFVVKNVSLEVCSGEIVGLLGPNGAGKTTFFNSIVGLISPNSGEVMINDIKLTSLPMYKRARHGIGYLPQESSIFTDLTVEDNILAVLEMIGLKKEKQLTKSEALISEFNLENIRHNLGSNLSGGERRRTEVARALATNPKFILLDEPFAGVDPIAVEELQRIIINLKKKNIGVLITDHNVHETLSITDRSYLLYEGKVLKSGTSKELSNDGDAKKFYLGEKFKLR